MSDYVSGGTSGFTVRLAIVDEVGGLGHAVEKRLKESKSEFQPEVDVVEVVDHPSPQIEEDLSSRVKNGELGGFLVLPKGLATGTATARFHTRTFQAMALLGPIQRAVSGAIISHRLNEEGKRAGTMQNVFRLARVRLISVLSHKQEKSKDNTFAIAIIAGMVLYMTLMVYGMSTMHSVMEEKSTRVIEILVSSIKPFDLLAGKIVSVAAVALTQYLVWAVTIGVLFASAAGFAKLLRPGATAPSISLPPDLLIYLVIFFLSGYFLYAALYAAAGAIVSTDEEARHVQMPLTLLILCSFLLFNVILNDPNSTLSVVLSILPFLSPILMTLRIAIETPPFWQIALSLTLSIVTTIEVIRISAKIYRVGILMYGKRPSLKELRRWLRYS
ncbi:MAG: ABC transporter permease [Acidobacteriota bacterium]